MMSDIFEDHAFANKNSPALKPRRLSVPINVNLQNAINAFKATYPQHNYSDTAVLTTMIQAGFRLWSAQRKAQRVKTEE
jgi:hypothetical protein